MTISASPVETVSRSIGKLKDRGVISLMASDEVVVLDSDKLRQIAKVQARLHKHPNDNKLVVMHDPISNPPVEMVRRQG